MDEELDTPPSEDDAAFIWLTSAARDVLEREKPSSEAAPETLALPTSK